MNGSPGLALAVLVAALTVTGAADPATMRHERVSVLNLAGQAAGTAAVNCDAGERIQSAVDAARPGDTIVVSGICAAHVVIRAEVTRITLDGQGSATIHGPIATEYVVYAAREGNHDRGVHNHRWLGWNPSRGGGRRRVGDRRWQHH